MGRYAIPESSPSPLRLEHSAKPSNPSRRAACSPASNVTGSKVELFAYSVLLQEQVVVSNLAVRKSTHKPTNRRLDNGAIVSASALSCSTLRNDASRATE